jgi:heme oxygenase
MDLLKSATAEQHRDAERRQLQQQMVTGKITTPTYVAWLGQMLLLHDALARAIAARGPAHQPLADVVRDDGVHVTNLRADLTALGADASKVTALPATANALQQLTDTAASDAVALLGANYVLEGSMNGNKYIAKALIRTLSAPAIKYLDPYGDDQRAVWAAYRERMNALTLDESASTRIVVSARSMFESISAISDELISVKA